MDQSNIDSEISLLRVVKSLRSWWAYITKYAIVIGLMTVAGSAIGYFYAKTKPTFFVASLSFVVEGDQKGGGLSGAMGLASQLGIDIGGSGGDAFTGSNLIELMKSRTIVQRALLNPFASSDFNGTFAQYLYAETEQNPKVIFPLAASTSSFSRFQDSILLSLYEGIIGGIMSIDLLDKKSSIINISVKHTNELFAKKLVENLVQEISNFYVETKSRKAQMNVNILTKKVDSVRKELYAAFTGAAIAMDNTYNLNPALAVKRVPSSNRQVDIQANSAILTQLVTNLEIARMNLMKETPLIQIIDLPVLPLHKVRVSKLKSLIIGGFIAFLIGITFFTVRRFLQLLAESAKSVQ